MAVDFPSVTRPNESAVRRVCLFGLSGDPPTGHGGHLGIVRALQRMTKDDDSQTWAFDEIRILPVYRHTFSSKRDRLVEFEHRYQMCRLAFECLNESVNGDDTEDGMGPKQHFPRVIVSDDERKSWQHAAEGMTDEERANLSVGTGSLLRYLASVEPNSIFTFCLGGDSFLDLMNGKWREGPKVLELIGGRLLVLYRPVETTSLDKEGRSTSFGATASADTLQERIQSVPGARMLQLDVSDEFRNVSSTQIRNKLNEAVAELRDNPRLIDPKVLEYIQRHGLYTSFSE